MRIQSFIEEKNELVKVEVEVALWPGLPNIHFLGRPDQNLKESSLRIKSAIKAAGFDFPVAQQIVVNLRPTHLPKSSRGIELAVAAAYLWMTEQVPPPAVVDELFVYGELSLFGEVSTPESLKRFNQESDQTVVTGRSENQDLPFKRWHVSHLKSLKTPEVFTPMTPASEEPERPMDWARDMFFSEVESGLLQILAVGGHHVLMAGPPGTGKSTLARALHGLMLAPSKSEMRDIRKNHFEMRWRPLIEPHHTTPRMSMIGGGNPPFPGEITRAHRGILMMDEFLEFDGQVLEAMREPFEVGRLRVGRLGGVEVFPADVQVVATTNLCPCGKWVPGYQNLTRCRYSLLKCRSYSQRLSGPLLDRFHVVHFPKVQAERTISAESVLEKINRAFDFQRQRGALKPNRHLSDIELHAEMDDGLKAVGFTSQPLSQRRRLSTLRVARTIADLAQIQKISLSEVDQAMKWTIEPFEKLERWE